MAVVTSAVFDVIDALLDAARAALPDVSVYDGFGVTENPGGFLMVGVEDPDLESAATSASVQQDWSGVGNYSRDEQGEITCAALSWNGDGNQRRARRDVQDITAGLEAVLRDNVTLGVDSLLWTSFGTDFELSQTQAEDGAVAMVVFKVFYKARLNR